MRREKRELLSRARSAKTGKKPSVLEVAFVRVGFRKGQRVVSFITSFAIAEADLMPKLGRSITCDEYADWWSMSRATAFREQAHFRECFPEFSTPSELIAACKATKVEASMSGLRQVVWSW